MLHIVTFESKAYGIAASVDQRPDGRYAVTLRDVDSGKTLPTVKLFNMDRRNDAVNYARKVADGEPDGSESVAL